MTAAFAAIVTLGGALAIGLIALYVARAAPARAAEQVVPAIYRIRRRYFTVIVVVLVAALVLTLPRVPYPAAAGTGEPHAAVSVTGYQWSWVFQPEAGQGVRLDGGTLVLPAGELIEFRVAAADVNHGMGIYDSEGRLLAQTQAMPGYVNRLRHRFEEPGTYHVLCMEFCGLVHHNMIARIEVE